MLSPADMVIIGAAALIFFGPDQLPKVARRAGAMIRDVQNTSQSFIREMERAADVADEKPEMESMSPAYDYRSYAEPRPASEPPLDSPPTHDPLVPNAAHPGPSPSGGGEASAPPSAIAHEDASGI